MMEEDAVSTGSEKVLVEKEGVFELVSASEMHAGQSTTVGQLSGHKDPVSGETEVENTEKNQQQSSDTPVAQEIKDTEITAESNRDTTGVENPPVNVGSAHEETHSPQVCGDEQQQDQGQDETVRQEQAGQQQTNASSDSAITSNQSSNGSSTSDVLPHNDTPAPPGHSSSSSSSSNSLPLHRSPLSSSLPPLISSHPSPSPIQTITQQLRPLGSKSLTMSANQPQRTYGKTSNRNVPRIISAPATRMTGRQSREVDEEKLRMNEQAFQSWLSKKNKELFEQLRQERLKTRKSEEEISRKKEENEQAFKHWLAMKQNQLVRKPADKSLPVINEEEERKRKEESFESWVSQKREQKRLQEDSCRRRIVEVEQTARKIDPEIAQAAYKR